MSPDCQRCHRRAATVAAAESRSPTWRPAAVLALIVAALWMLAAPAPASAHGPVNPAATSYLATVRQAPAGLDCRIVDGDQRMWLQVSPRQTVIVLDYRGAPYLRFSPSGVQVNHNSSMYYL